MSKNGVCPFLGYDRPRIDHSPKSTTHKPLVEYHQVRHCADFLQNNHDVKASKPLHVTQGLCDET